MDSEPAEKLYLLDANVLISAHDDYYPVDRIQPFWNWLLEEATAGRVKIPLENYNEITPPEESPLCEWVNNKEVSTELILDEEVNQDIFNRVLKEGYAGDLSDIELTRISRDAFLVAYALMGPNRIVVTKEVSKPTKTRAKRKIPNVCDIMKVPWMDDFQFYRERDFRIP